MTPHHRASTLSCQRSMQILIIFIQKYNNNYTTKHTWYQCIFYGGFKTNLIMSLIFRVNLTLGGLFHMECEFYRTPYKKRRFDNYSRHEHLDAAKEVLRRRVQDRVWKNSKTLSKVLGSLQHSTMKSSGACQTRAHVVGV
jgi:hypothetical protein